MLQVSQNITYAYYNLFKFMVLLDPLLDLVILCDDKTAHVLLYQGLYVFLK